MTFRVKKFYMHLSCQFCLLSYWVSAILIMIVAVSKTKASGQLPKILVISISCILLLVLIVKMRGVGPERKPAALPGLGQVEKLTDGDYGILGFRLFESGEGEKRWKVISKFAELRRVSGEVALQEVNAEFYARNTGNVIRTQSRTGFSALNKNEVDLQGDVVIESQQGYRFEVPRLLFVGQAREFRSLSDVRMLGPDVQKPQMILTGTGLVAKIDVEKFDVQKNVRAKRLLRSGSWLYVDANSSEFFSARQQAIFRGNVRSKLPEMDINSEWFELSVQPEGESFLARGQVAVRMKNKVARAESAFFEIGSGQMVLEGQASIRAIGKGNEIRGRRIVVYLDEDRVDVEEAQGRVE